MGPPHAELGSPATSWWSARSFLTSTFSGHAGLSRTPVLGRTAVVHALLRVPTLTRPGRKQRVARTPDAWGRRCQT